MKIEFDALSPLIWSEEEKMVLQKLLRDRYNFMWSDAHGIAHLLDPRYMGRSLSRTEREEIERDIEKLYPEIAAGCELDHYKAFIYEMRDRNPNFADTIGVEKRTVYLWWQARDAEDFPHIRQLALRMFSLCCSSSASERNFSTFAFIHNKLRNRLKDDKVEKLVHIFSNHQHLKSAGFVDQDEDYAANSVDADEILFTV